MGVQRANPVMGTAMADAPPPTGREETFALAR